MSSFQKVTPYLWFEKNTLVAAEFYCSLFDDSQILSASPMIVEFELQGTNFMALNGGPQFKFNEAVSFFITCDDQEEVDHFWNNLTANGGEESMCGWCRDRFGLWWQVVPQRFIDLMQSGEPDRVKRVTDAMLKMKKMVIADLEAAHNG
ncbi:MAG: VOC family protein [Bacteroidetes bacterium]|nr:VOC family protein [Bacteroidota bacterium]